MERWKEERDLRSQDDDFYDNEEGRPSDIDAVSHNYRFSHVDLQGSPNRSKSLDKSANLDSVDRLRTKSELIKVGNVEEVKDNVRSVRGGKTPNTELEPLNDFKVKLD